MNIAIVCYPTFGGSGVLATELGKALADKGHNIHFITYQQPVRLPAAAKKPLALPVRSTAAAHRKPPVLAAPVKANPRLPSVPTKQADANWKSF